MMKMPLHSIHKKVLKMVFYSTGLILLIVQCGKESPRMADNDALISTDSHSENPPANNTRPNVLFVLADDLGIDAMPGYSLGAQKPSLPTLERLANEGVRFTKAWANPVCTPTRASILTGKYGVRTGVVGVEQNNNINPNERILQRAFTEQSDGAYQTSIIGKWHVSAGNDFDLPEAMGVGHYAGLFGGGVDDYAQWRFTTNGATTVQDSYITTALTDLAIEWIAEQEQPWFCWLAYTAPHSPFHLPPQALHHQGDLPADEASIEANPLPYYFAMIESLDTELGRLLNSLSPAALENTLIVFMGDNGTPNGVAQTPYVSTKAKGSLYQGGIHVPLIFSGHGVDRMGEEEDALITAVDLYNTFLEAAGLSGEDGLDSQNFWPLVSSSGAGSRVVNYAEVQGDRPNRSGYTISDGRYKLIVFDNGNERFFDVLNDAGENTNLLNGTRTDAAESALTILRARAAAIRQ